MGMWGACKMDIPVKFWFNKRFWYVFGIAAVFFTIIIAVLVGWGYLNRATPVYTPNEYGGQNIRVRVDDGDAAYPPELPDDFVPLYSDAQVRDVWIDTDEAGSIINVNIIYVTQASLGELVAFYDQVLGADSRTGDDIFEAVLNGMNTTVYIDTTDEGTKVEFYMEA
jgi:hypothetical protein